MTNQEKGLSIFIKMLYNWKISGTNHSLSHQTGIPYNKQDANANRRLWKNERKI